VFSFVGISGCFLLPTSVLGGLGLDYVHSAGDQRNSLWVFLLSFHVVCNLRFFELCLFFQPGCENLPLVSKLLPGRLDVL
jgi:hypothetical protein